MQPRDKNVRFLPSFTKQNVPFLPDFGLISSLQKVEVGRERTSGQNARVALGVHGGTEEDVVPQGRVLDPSALRGVGDSAVDLLGHNIAKKCTSERAERGGKKREEKGVPSELLDAQGAKKMSHRLRH